MAVCIEMLIPNGDSGRERERERERKSSYCALGSFQHLFLLSGPRETSGLGYFFYFTTAFHVIVKTRGSLLKKKSGKRGKKTHLAKTQKSSKIICIDPPHQHDCVKRWRSLFFLLFRLCVVALVSFYFHGGKKYCVT
jgi:hypothetical protein